MKKLLIFTLIASLAALVTEAKPVLKEIRTSSDHVIVAYFTSETVKADEIDISDPGIWKIDGKPAVSIHKYVMQADACDHHVYLETDRLVEGKEYRVETPYGNTQFRFGSRETLCESIKVNQVGYSALSKTRFGLFTIWQGTGGNKMLEGKLPGYEVYHVRTGKTVTKGKLKEAGLDSASMEFTYRIDLSKVPEGGPYRVSVKGFGTSYPFGVGGEFSRQLAHQLFRAQYLQRCGCPIHEPDIRQEPCHTTIYEVSGPIGEANIVVNGDEPTFKAYGGYHDAGDADRRAYHMSNPIINLMIYEVFPEYFTDGQYNIPGDFDENYHIINYANNIPDIIDEAEWGTLVWEYLQKEDGSIYFGTETKGYPDPFAAPMDKDNKKYGTVKTDPRATNTGAGLFLHLARIIKPYKPEKASELAQRADKAMKYGDETMAAPERLYYHIQRYLYYGEEKDHQKIRELYTIADSMKNHIFLTPGYSLNDKNFDNPAYIMSYVVEKERPTDQEIVSFFKKAIENAANENLLWANKYVFPVGNPPSRGGWGHNVRQPQYAAAPLLHWRLSGDRKYFDAASVLMDWKLGLNPMGISYVTELGSYQVHNIHDRESAFTKSKGYGLKPGITAFGPGVIGRRNNAVSIPAMADLPYLRKFTDDMAIISFTEFTIFETMHYDALYTILSGGGKWNGKDPFQ